MSGSWPSGEPPRVFGSLAVGALVLFGAFSLAGCRERELRKLPAQLPAATTGAPAANTGAPAANERASLAPNDRLPLYFERPIQIAELRGKTLRELEILRASIHARAGLVFLELRLRDYFGRTGAYRPGGYDAAKLSAVDQQNLRTIATHRASIDRAELEQRWRRMLDEHRHATDSSLQHRAAFSTDGRVVAVGPSVVGARTPLSLFETSTGKRISTIEWAGRLLHAVFVGSDHVVVVSDYDAEIGGWRSTRPSRSVLLGAKARADGSRDPEPRWACVSTDGTIVAVEQRGGVGIFDLSSKTPANTVPLPPGNVIPDRCAFAGARAAFVKSDLFGAGYMLDVGSRTVTRLAVPDGNSMISPDGSWLARWDERLDGYRGDLEVWSLRGTPSRAHIFPGSADAVPMAFSPDGGRLIYVDKTGRMFVWDVASGTRSLWRDATPYLSWPAMELVLDSVDAPLSWELAGDAPTPPRRKALDAPTSVLFSPDGSLVLVAYARGYVELRDARSGQPVATFRGHQPWADDELWEMTLLAEALGLPPARLSPLLPEFVDPLKHLAALDGRLPDGVVRRASRARLSILRNAIIARRGARIESATLRELFVGAGWYRPSDTYSPAALTATDRDNLARIERRERALGGPIGDGQLRAALNSRRPDALQR